MKQEKQYYHLLVDLDGTLRSSPQSTGIVITDEQAAKDWVTFGKIGYSRNYEVLQVSEEANVVQLDQQIKSLFRARFYAKG